MLPQEEGSDAEELRWWSVGENHVKQVGGTQYPYVELCACGENWSWLRLSGKVVFSQDRSIKSRIIEEAVPLIKAVYKTPDNPLWALFYLDEATATIADLSGNPPQTFRL